MKHVHALSLFVAATLLAAPSLAQQDASDEKDGGTLPDWLMLSAEYRVRTLFMRPLDVAGDEVVTMDYTKQRLRVEPGLTLGKYVRIYSQFDILSGVLFGDNGEFGKSPEPSFGMAATSLWPNNSTYAIGLLPGQDPLKRESYGPVLESVEPIKVNRIYGEVLLPFGILRVGRQPMADRPGILYHDGGRNNRWGVSKYSPTGDRFLFATKISELFKMISRGSGYQPDRSLDSGVFFGVAYDQVVNDDVFLQSDNLHQVGVLLRWKEKEASWFGWKWRDFLLEAVFAARFSKEFDTKIYAIPLTAEFTVGRFHFLGEFAALLGHTREISEGLAALREPDPAKRVIHDQTIRAFGARGVLDVTLGPVVATLEVDFASGDSDPRDETPFETFFFARDSNVGLYLFEHVLAFQTARMAAVGIQNLKNVGSQSFPLTELASDGRFHNAIAIFPQVLYRPHHNFDVRFGALFAFAHKPVIDPIMTLLNEDGVEITDDAVNWNGGRPGRYYGTELDLQLSWRYGGHFSWVLEGAVLFPGSALRNESGDAVASFMLENRFSFTF